MAKTVTNAALLKAAETVFTRFFGDYHSQNRKVQSVDYSTMDKDGGFVAQIRYSDFTQYVIFHIHSPITEQPALVNTCFVAERGSERLLCYLTDVLNWCDSDDIAFYHYPNCLTQEAIKSALKDIMQATQRYYDKLTETLHNPAFFDEVSDYYRDDEGYIIRVEDSMDFDYYDYGVNYANTDELLRYLKRQKKKGEALTGYEARALRVYSAMNTQQRKREDKQKISDMTYPKKYRFYLYAPIVVVCLIFGILGVVLGIMLDHMLFADWVDRKPFNTSCVFLVIGIAFGLIVIDIVGKPIYRLLVPSKDYDSFSIVYENESVHGVMRALMYGGVVLLCGFFLIWFGFNGIGVTNDETIEQKEFFFSKTQTYMIEDTQIAIVKGDGKGEYRDTAYAFCLDNEWVEYGVPGENAKKIIENAIEKYNKEVPVYETVEEIKE